VNFCTGKVCAKNYLAYSLAYRVILKSRNVEIVLGFFCKIIGTKIFFLNGLRWSFVCLLISIGVV